MFDVGFWELVLIGVVLLLVVGPERLPKLARTAGMWIGRARRTLSAVKAEIDREIKAQELKEILEKQAQSKPLQTIIEDLSDDAFEKKSPAAEAAPAAAPGDQDGRSAPGRPAEGNMAGRPDQAPAQAAPKSAPPTPPDAPSGKSN